jgi:hypothetical protein
LLAADDGFSIEVKSLLALGNCANSLPQSFLMLAGRYFVARLTSSEWLLTLEDLAVTARRSSGSMKLPEMSVFAKITAGSFLTLDCRSAVAKVIFECSLTFDGLASVIAVRLLTFDDCIAAGIASEGFLAADRLACMSFSIMEEREAVEGAYAKELLARRASDRRESLMSFIFRSWSDIQG